MQLDIQSSAKGPPEFRRQSEAVQPAANWVQQQWWVTTPQKYPKQQTGNDALGIEQWRNY